MEGCLACPSSINPRWRFGVGAIEKRPVVRDDAIAIRPMVYLSISYDHRVVDEAVAEQFMVHQGCSKPGMSRCSRKVDSQGRRSKVQQNLL